VPGGVRQERVDPADPALSDPLVRRTNPLLPSSMQISVNSLSRGGTGQFEWARERLRVLSADTPGELATEYQNLQRAQKSGLNDAQRYGLALARLRNSGAAEARRDLTELLKDHPDNLWVALALAESESRAGQPAQANARFDALLRQHPGSRPVALTYAEILNEQGGREAGQRAQAMLRPLLSQSGNDPVFQQRYARASELAGDTLRASEAYAEAAFLNGRPEQALMQLQALKKQPALDYVGRARVDARIESITPTVLEMRRQGINDPELERR